MSSFPSLAYLRSKLYIINHPLTMSSESNKRYRLFLSRSQHQLKEVEFNCREVISLSQQLNLMAGDVQATEVNSRKIEFMKGEIKDKLREYSSYID